MTESEFPLRLRVLVLCLAACSLTPLNAQTSSGSDAPRIGGLFPSTEGAGESLRRLTPYVSLLGTYTFDAPVVASNGTQIRQTNTDGLMANLGLEGYQSWRRSQLGIGFRGSYRRQFNQDVQSSDSESLMLGFEHQATEHTTISFTEAATTSNRGIGMTSLGIGANMLLPGLGNVDPGLSSAPSTELLDQRVFFSSTGVRVGFQKSARLGFFVGGSGFMVRRQLAGVPSMNGASANGGLQYALSRRQMLSVQYSLVHYSYTNNFGKADTNMAAIGYGVQLNRYWTLQTHAGTMRIGESRLTKNVLPAEIAAILGQGFTVERYNGTMITWVGGAGISGAFRRSTLSLNYRHNVGGGNGIYLASRQDSAIGTYSYQLMRRATASLGSNYIRQSAVSQNYTPLEQVSGYASVSYRLSGSFFLSGTFTARHVMKSVASVYHPETLVAAFGIGYTPGRGLPIW